jgi:hypothetical protein
VKNSTKRNHSGWPTMLLAHYFDRRKKTKAKKKNVDLYPFHAGDHHHCRGDAHLVPQAAPRGKERGLCSHDGMGKKKKQKRRTRLDSGFRHLPRSVSLSQLSSFFFSTSSLSHTGLPPRRPPFFSRSCSNQIGRCCRLDLRQPHPVRSPRGLRPLPAHARGRQGAAGLEGRRGRFRARDALSQGAEGR